ncbi:hypothetical protein VB711_03490 [Cronbergia sp. UHCC 0137]|uniref:hypothetical protein n=1 Tax=Cronbergia sp. UHCC 0137 TaxID=3110239 RepID=UPI002B214556|nr:hypothetical protein [Cronbergia sp. UHCC 0137]MEA5616907.1 hypothetical protein [Cronbergia sp. UHCC 0137]
MEQDLKQEVQEIKISIDKLSNNIGQQFSSLNENLYINFEQISKQISNLSAQASLMSETPEINLAAAHQDSLQQPQKQTKIPNEYFIQYPYIDITKHSSWLESLKKYSKDMAECRHKKKITNFCKSANETLESAIELLFKEEYKCLSESNKTFLEAYQRVKNSINKMGWEFTEIYLNNNDKIESKDFKLIDDKYISWKSIEQIRRSNFNASVEIFFEILKPNFMNSQHLKEKFYLIKHLHQLRNLDAHGSASNIKLKVNELNHYAKCLYSSTDNYTNITEVVSWFVKEVYNRFNKIYN